MATAKSKLNGIAVTRYAGHCGYPTKSMRGACWRKTRQYIKVKSTKGLDIYEFRCYQHIGKP